MEMPLGAEKRDHIGVLTLSRPESRNAWGQDFTDGLPKVFAEWATDPDVRCVIITGDEAGAAFSAGADLKSVKTHAERTPAEFVNSLQEPRSFVSAAPEAFPKPVIAAVNGYAVGNGCIFSFSRSEEHTSELQSLMRISYAVFCLQKKNIIQT